MTIKEKAGQECRVVTRWRQNWRPHGLAARFFTLFDDLGAFIMEQRMLRGTKAQAKKAPNEGAPASDQAAAAVSRRTREG